MPSCSSGPMRSCMPTSRMRSAHGGFALPEEIAGRYGEQVEVRLDDAELTEKLEASRRYPSQLDQLVASFGDFLDRAGLGREVLWLRRDGHDG